MSAYKTRDKRLKLLGFNSYREYLQSFGWKAIRAYVLKDQKCKRCNSRWATQVHHLDYETATLVGELDAADTLITKEK